MSKKDEALKLALEALEPVSTYGRVGSRDADTAKAQQAITAIKKALAEQPAQQGWKLVPVEPTPEMLKAADDGDDEYTRRNFGPAVHRVMQGPYDHYIAMLNAAPQPAQPQEPKVLMQEIARLHDRIKDLERDVEFLSRPAQRKPWAGLTEEELSKLVSCTKWRSDESMHTYAVRACRAVEAKLREKNNG